MGIILKTKEEKEFEIEFRMLSCDNIDSDVIEGHISCVRDEYGDSYPISDSFNSVRLKQLLIEDRLIINIAYTMDGKAIATLTMKKSADFRGIGVLGTFVVNKKYRGLGLCTSQVRNIICHPYANQLISLLICATTDHFITQHICTSMGFIPCGFDFSRFNNENFHHSAQSHGIKLSLSNYVKPHTIKYIGAITIPQIHQNFIETIYEQMGISFIYQAETPLKKHTQFTVKEDELHQTGFITIQECGEDLAQCIVPLLVERDDKALHTVNVLLNMKDSSVVAGFEQLLHMGFFFSGIQPLTQDGEYIVMHHPKTVPLDLDKFVIESASISTFEYIKKHIKNKEN